MNDHSLLPQYSMLICLVLHLVPDRVKLLEGRDIVTDTTPGPSPANDAKGSVG